MNTVLHVSEFERQRMLGIMGVDVYVPRTAPIARAVEAAPPCRPLLSGNAPKLDVRHCRESGTPVPLGSRGSIETSRVLVDGAGIDGGSPLLAAVLRGARLRREDWAMAVDDAASLPVFQFGVASGKHTALPTLVLPDLAQLRLSVIARRDSWTRLRSWLRDA
ncbi:MAG: hypothetical protein ABIP49_02860 [Lysobacterales bacterium]